LAHGLRGSPSHRVTPGDSEHPAHIARLNPSALAFASSRVSLDDEGASAALASKQPVELLCKRHKTAPLKSTRYFAERKRGSIEVLFPDVSTSAQGMLAQGRFLAYRR
jgi:hypothetical protein